MSKIIAVNAGSSSFKFQLFEMPSEKVLTKGIVERIGLNDSIFAIEVDGEKVKTVSDIQNHAVAVDMLLEKLVSHNIIASLEEIDGVGHRVVHGGEAFTKSVVITEAVIEKIEELSELSPLHNPANLVGIRAFQKALPHAGAVAVFDTAFHSTMPEKAYRYSIPTEYYTEFGVRKYGFHGTSHQYVSQRCAELLEKDIKDLKIITCHIGNGGSVTAVDGGVSVDTSMGFTPLEGVTMGTRSGSIDPAVVPFLEKKLGKTSAEIVDILNKQSGVAALSEISSDMRDVEGGVTNGDAKAILAMDIYHDRIKKYVASYAAVMGGVDAIVFTAGVGENGPETRAEIVKGLEFMGVEIDPALNDGCRKERNVSKEGSRVQTLVIPTDEEIMIARDTLALI